MKNAVFLSASVPDPNSDNFVRDADTVAVASAVHALIFVLLGRKPLIWGGHPSITPMIWSVAESLQTNYSDWVKLYQSTIFRDSFPEQNDKFKMLNSRQTLVEVVKIVCALCDIRCSKKTHSRQQSLLVE